MSWNNVAENYHYAVLLFFILILSFGLYRTGYNSGMLSGALYALTPLVRGIGPYCDTPEGKMPNELAKHFDEMKGVKSFEQFLDRLHPLGSAMGYACWERGTCEESSLQGENYISLEKDIDLNVLCYLAHEGFEYLIFKNDGFSGKKEAERASRLIERVQMKLRKEASSEHYIDLSYTRFTMIQRKWG